MIYGVFGSGFGLNPPEYTVVPRLGSTIGFFLLMAVPAIVWRKDLFIVGLAILAGFILWTTIAS